MLRFVMVLWKHVTLNNRCQKMVGNIKYWKYQYIGIKFWILNINISRTSVKSPSISIWRIKQYFPVFTYWSIIHCYSLMEFDCMYIVYTIPNLNYFKKIRLKLCFEIIFQIIELDRLYFIVKWKKFFLWIKVYYSRLKIHSGSCF